MEVYSICQFMIQVSIHKTLREIILSSKVYRTTDSENQLPVSVSFLMYHFIFSLKLCVFSHCLCVCLMKISISQILGTHISVDGQKDGFLLSCIILIYRKYTRICFITRSIAPQGL